MLPNEKQHFIKSNLITTNLSFKTRPCYSDTLVAPLNLCKSTLRTIIVSRGFVAVERWEHSNIPKKNYEEQDVPRVSKNYTKLIKRNLKSITSTNNMLLFLDSTQLT